MPDRLSRSKIAAYAADKLMKHESKKDAKKDILTEIAAHLVDTGRTRELELIVREIEAALAEKGVIVADVTSAHPLTHQLRGEVEKRVDAKELHLRETVDPTVLGGVRIELPGKRFDGTIATRLMALKAKKI